MRLTFDLTPGFKKLSIAVGIAAALFMADTLTRQYHVKQAKLEYLCVYRFDRNCSCPVGDTACIKKCDTLREQQRGQCMEGMKPTFYKLKDQFTWALLIFLPLAYGVGVAAVWVISRLRRVLGR